MASDPADMTLDELRRALAPILPAHAAIDGWGRQALGEAAAELGVPADRAALAFPAGGIEMIDAWFAAIDDAMARALPPEAMAMMKVRERITQAVLLRLEAAAGHREALRRAIALLGQPGHAAHGTRLAWRAADAMWRLAGDGSTDFAYYSKRLTLAGVYSATILIFLDDESEGHADTQAFLDRRIAGIIRFEQWKAGLKTKEERRFSPSRLLGRLRYPAR